MVLKLLLMDKCVINIYKNKILLSIIAALCVFNESIYTSHHSKNVGKFIINAVKMQTAYPEDDTHNHNIMNGSFFDNRAFKNKDEKREFIAHDFKHMQVSTDMNNELIEALTQSDYSRQQLYKFMYIAKQVAMNKGTEIIELPPLERACRIIELKTTVIAHNENSCTTSHHEAAHAVISATQDAGMRLFWASIQPDDRTFGRVRWYRTVKYEEQIDDQRRNEMTMLFAGGVQEQHLEGYAFNNDTEAFHDFLSRGNVRSDLAGAKKQAEKLAEIEAKQNRSNCLISLSHSLAQDLTISDDFFTTYAQCTNIHCNKDVLAHHQSEILKKQYCVAVQDVKALQPIISAVAKELFEKKVISGKRIKEIIQETEASKK